MQGKRVLLKMKHHLRKNKEVAKLSKENDEVPTSLFNGLYKKGDLLL